MKLEHLKRAQKLHLTDKKLLQELGEQDDKTIEIYLDLLTYFPVEKNIDEVMAVALHWLINQVTPHKIEKLTILRDILGCYFPHNKYEIRTILYHFIDPMIRVENFIIKYKEDLITLCKKEGFIENILNNASYIDDITNALDSNDLHRRNIALDAHLIAKGDRIHQLAFDYYESLEKIAKDSWSDEKLEDVLTFAERISRNYTMITANNVTDNSYYYIIKHYQKEFMDDACFNKILSNREVLTNRNSRELLSLAKYYAKYKTDHMERVMFILTNPVLLGLKIYYQHYLFTRYCGMKHHEFNAYMDLIAFILDEFKQLDPENLENILDYTLIHFEDPLTISTLLQYGWSVEALEQYLEENHIDSFDFDDEIKIYHYSSKK